VFTATEDLVNFGQAIAQGDRFFRFTRFHRTEMKPPPLLTDATPGHRAAGFQQFTVEGDHALLPQMAPRSVQGFEDRCTAKDKFKYFAIAIVAVNQINGIVH
jgi:hypothetical protein